MAKAKSVYVCSSCGYETPRWLGRCPECGEEDTHIHAEDGMEVVTVEHKSDPLAGFNAYVKKRLTMRDVMIEYDDLCNIVVLFDRKPEELAEIRSYIMAYKDAEAYIKEL